VAETARALGIELLQPERVNDDDARARIAAAEPEALIVCAYGALIRPPLLDEHELLNVHPSLLPRWRGAAPIERAIMAGDAETGVSIMRLTEGLDSGPVCLQAPEAITADDDHASLSERLQRLGGELLVRALDERPPCAEQGEDGVTYAEKIAPEDRWLRGERSAAELERVVRALRPHIGARAALPGGDALGVSRARVAEGVSDDVAPGELAARDGRLLLGAADGALELEEVQPPGGRPMAASAYLRGHPLR
jgi:methionyl-tRNA formyltransferase